MKNIAQYLFFGTVDASKISKSKSGDRMTHSFSRFYLLMLGLCSLTILPSCFHNKSKDEVENQSLYVINVLGSKEFDDCSIVGSVNVPFENVTEFAKTLPKNAEVVVYCSNYMCAASGEAYRIFRNLGFEQVWAYEAGMAEWYQQGLPIKGACASAYLKSKIEKPAEDDMLNEEASEAVRVITTQELYEKMVAAGIIRK